MSGHLGLRDDARIGALLAAQIARLFTPPPTATDARLGPHQAPARRAD